MRYLSISMAAWSCGIILGTIGGAAAADLAYKAPPVVAVAPAFSWTGFYVGGNVGYAFDAGGDADTVGTPGFLDLIPGGIVPGSLDLGTDGFIGGLQVGYNYQIDSIVLGVEADIQWLDANGSDSFIGNPVLGTTLLTQASSELKFLGTVRARLGFLPTERLLIYGTGGLAYGDVDVSARVDGIEAPALSWAGSKSNVEYGYAVGGGAEYAFTNNWTFKVEYLYYDLGDETVRTIPNAAAIATVPGVAYDTKVETSGQVVRVGVNYKF